MAKTVEGRAQRIERLSAQARGLSKAAQRAAAANDQVAFAHLSIAASERLQLAREIERMESAYPPRRAGDAG